jgi:hypothetical protein
MGDVLMLGLTEYVIVFGQVTFVAKTSKKQAEFAEEFCEKIYAGKPFIVDMSGALMIINPCPGMTLIVMTKEQFERNRGMAKLTGQA